VRLTQAPLCVAMIIAGSAVWFVVSTILVGEVPDSVMLAVSLVVALAFLSAFVGTPVRERLSVTSRTEALVAGAAGILAWYAAPMLVLSQRATDAPSGTETLFFTTAGTVLVVSIVAYAFRAERPTLTQYSGVALSVLGSAALLGNWERPSSFSPFLKFPMQEALILAAGALLALGLILGRRSARAFGLRSSLWVGMAAATAVALVVALPDARAAFDAYTRLWPQLLLTGVALSTLATGFVGLSAQHGLVRSTAWLVVTPIALTGLTAIERLTGVFGPVPIVWAGAVGGSVLGLLGLLVIQATGSRSPQAAEEVYGSDGIAAPPGPRATSTWGALTLGAIATGVSLVALFLPAFSASVVGTTEAGASFEAAWDYAGVETVAGWLPLVVALIALSSVMDLDRRIGEQAALTAAVSGLLAAALYPLVVTTPLHTWTRWIPAEIQQAYGTEYARLTLEVAPHIVRYAGLALSGLACATLIVILVLRQRAGGALTDVVLKENE